SVAEALEKEFSERFEERIEEAEEECVDEGDDEKELEAIVPGPETGALHGEFGLAESPSHFDLPSPRVGVDDPPHERGGVGRLVGEQVPGLVALAPARDDQPERTGEGVMPDGNREDAAPAALSAGAGDHPALPRLPAADQHPGGSLVAEEVPEVITLLPA